MTHSPSLALRSAGAKGRGVFAARPVSAGTHLLDFTGPVVPIADVRDFTHAIQIADDHFLGPSGGLDDFVNHSCDPNCGLSEGPGRLALIALRAIRRSEEITFDYSTCMVAEEGFEGCRCGATICRGRVLPYTRLPLELRRRYRSLGVVPSFAVAAAQARRSLRRMALPATALESRSGRAAAGG